MNAQAALEPGRVVAGRYRVERQIGAGGVGSVYLVRHVHTDEELALKVLQTHALKDASAVERFRKEARAPARIASEHVTRVTDADTAPDLDNAPFLVMELLRGRDLTQLVAEGGPLAPPLVVELLRQAARALDKAHGMGIVHRDLKPDNLFLTQREDGSPCIKLLDFGIARIADGAPAEMKTQAGLVFGTPGYMAPEQMTGEVDLISPASDIWAMGLVAFYLLVGRDYWSAGTLMALYARILSEPILPPSQRGSTLGEGFDQWFLRCVVRDPTQRIQTAGEAATELARALGVPVAAPRFSLADIDVAPVRGPVVQATAPTELLVARPSLTSTPPPQGAARANRTGLVALAGLAGIALLIGVVALARAAFSTGSEAAVLPVASTAVLASASPAEPPLVPLNPPASASVARASAVAPSSSTAGGEPPASSAAADTPAAAPVAPPHETAPSRVPMVRGGAFTREQQDRLNALQRLCDQGTVTAAECMAKRNAILRGP